MQWGYEGMVLGVNRETSSLLQQNSRYNATRSVRAEEESIVHRQISRLFVWRVNPGHRLWSKPVILALFGLDVGITYSMKHDLVLILGQCSLVSLQYEKKRSLILLLHRDTNYKKQFTTNKTYSFITLFQS